MIYKLSDAVVFDDNSGLLKLDDGEIQLSARQSQLLQLLCKNSGEYVSKDSIINALYSNRHASNDVITKFVSLLRAKLLEANLEDVIETRKSYGYKVNVIQLVIPSKKSHLLNNHFLYVFIISILVLGIGYYIYLKEQQAPIAIAPGTINIQLSERASHYKDSFCAEASVLALRSVSTHYQFLQGENVKGVYSIFIDSIDEGTSVTLTNNLTDTIELQKTYPSFVNKNMYQLRTDVYDIINVSNRPHEPVIKEAYNNNATYFCTAQYDWHQFMTGKVTKEEHGKNAKALFDSFSVNELDKFTLILYLKFAYESYSFGSISKNDFENIIYNEPISTSTRTTIQAQIALYNGEYDRVIEILSSRDTNLDTYSHLILYNAYAEQGEQKKAKAILYSFYRQFPEEYQEHLYKYVDTMFKREGAIMPNAK
ncbi:winged helix-turn-helix domain-containing protein [Vibrio sp.]|nr:winged helix-turn-helix domain-containing protein [Vibrio sp.]